MFASATRCPVARLGVGLSSVQRGLAFFKYKKELNLRHMAKLQFVVDPRVDKASSVRHMYWLATSPKIMVSNPKCEVEFKVVADEQMPRVNMTWNEGGQSVIVTNPNTKYDDLLDELMMTQALWRHANIPDDPEFIKTPRSDD